MLNRPPISLALVLAATFSLTACGAKDGASSPGTGSADSASSTGSADARAALEHIHGLGVDPKSHVLYVATHHGLFQAAAGQVKVQRVGTSQQDIMGFSVIGPQRFLGSGHPAAGQNGPPNLGLIQSEDGGKRWRTISLLGAADFHVLRSSGRYVYGFDSSSGALMVSSDGGRGWVRRTAPAAMFDLAISPSDPLRVVISTERGLFASITQGKSWRALRSDTAGLLAWPERAGLVLVDGQGQVSRSADAGRTFKPVGSISGQPAALVGDGQDLYAALADGSVLRSTNGGADWAVRATA